MFGKFAGAVTLGLISLGLVSSGLMSLGNFCAALQTHSDGQVHGRVHDGVNGRAVRELRLDTAAAIKRSKDAEGALLTAAVLDLCRLHEELVRHPQFPLGGVVGGSRARIAARLGDMARELKRREQKATLLDQTEDSAAGTLIALESFHQRHLRMAGFLAGGPAGQMEWMKGNFAPGDENIAALINLIQTTINPDIWRSAGGDAAIGWWQTSQALVVTADMMTQQRIAELLGALR